MTRHSSRNLAALISTLGVAALVSGCQTSASSDTAMEDEVMSSGAMIAVENQAVVDSVTVASVTMDVDGFVVVHAANPDGTPVVPDSIGHIAVTTGTTINLEVPLDQPVAAGDKLFVMLHGDSGEIGVYEFKTGSTDVDLPIVVDDAPVITPIFAE